ncbi:MAG: hypothetical protein Fur0040_01930 [Sideroxydans sp.]
MSASELRIYIGPDWQGAESPCAWCLRDKAGQVLQSGTAPLRDLPQAEAILAILPAAEVLTLARMLPPIKKRRLEAALPLAVEDATLSNAEELHVVPGARLEDGRTVLHVVARERLRQVTAACAAAGLRLERVVAEYALAAPRTDEWWVAWMGDRGWLALPHGQGWALGQGDAAQPPAELRLHWQAASRKPTVLRVQAASAPQWAELPVVAAPAFDWRQAPLAADAPNLLWGKFAPPLRMATYWPRLRPLLWIVLLALAIETAGYNLQWLLLAREKAQLQQNMTRLLQETFGSEVQVVDAPLQMRRALAQARHAAGMADDGDLLPLLGRLSAAVAQQTGVEVRALRYGGARLEAELLLPNQAAAEALQRSLAAQGGQATLHDVHEEGGHFRGNLRLSSGGMP